MMLFTTGDILKLTGVPATTFDDWCSKKLVEPISGGSGTGNHRQWSLMQVVGFVVAEEIRNSEQGCVPVFIGKTVAAFGSMSEEWLKSELQKQGNGGYVMPHYGKPLLTGDTRHFPNVKTAYAKVLKYAEKKKRK